MGFVKRLVFALVFVLHTVFEVESDCKLSLNKPSDFSSPQPLFLQNGEFLAPNAFGAILVKRSEAITVSCGTSTTGSNSFITLGNYTTAFNTMEAHCVADTTFSVGEWVVKFKDIRCNKNPILSADKTGIQCYTGSQLIRVGYWIREQFKQLYEVCFNGQLLTTTFVHHVIGPSNYYTQFGRRPNFKDPGHFGKISIAKAYKLQNQREKINEILGADMDKKYLTKNQQLTRGHLAPRADFPLRTGQAATFIFANAAPQWMRGNAGDWAALEQSVRSRLWRGGARAHVYTGTHGAGTLRDKDGVPRQIYLATDENNNPVVPVPMYYYKVVYEPETKAAIAFVSINSSYHNQTELAALTFCEDVCQDNPDYRWIHWRADGTTSFCCTFEDFSRKIDHLRHLEVERQFA